MHSPTIDNFVAFCLKVMVHSCRPMSMHIIYFYKFEARAAFQSEVTAVAHFLFWHYRHYRHYRRRPCDVCLWTLIRKLVNKLQVTWATSGVHFRLLHLSLSKQWKGGQKGCITHCYWIDAEIVYTAKLHPSMYKTLLQKWYIQCTKKYEEKIQYTIAVGCVLCHATRPFV